MRMSTLAKMLLPYSWGPEAETDGLLLTSGTMFEEYGREKHVTMRE